jgi:DNA-binding transcriptional ArsR family regulator
MESLLFESLADPTRRRLLARLGQGECAVGALVEAVGLSQPAVSKQLKILREAGLATVRADGQRRFYSLRPEPLAELDAWLEPYRRFWAGKLDALERHLDKEPETEGT